VKIVLFGDHRVGVWQGERVVDANLAVAKLLAEKRGSRNPQADAAGAAPSELNAFIAAGQRALDLAREAAEYAISSGASEPIAYGQSAVKLQAPWLRGNRIACAGANFALHLAGIRAANEGHELNVEEVRRQSREGGPWGFWKVPDAVKGPDDDVRYPSRATLFDYEGEAAVIIGKPARDVSAAQARECFWGVTLVNDWSIRNDMGQGRPMSFNLPKVFDDSTSMGPCILVDDFDPQNIPVRTTVNGQVRQDYNTDQMTWSFAEFLELLSRDFTFQPGDVLSGGTGAGTAMDSARPGPDGQRRTDLYLKPGDVVEVSSPNIGILRNPIVNKEGSR
jgi:2-keto-4-pentenoate hydratase/2-oxohepta-3-ene-1,7-dioic acid hydratase in catechol pathway